MSYRFYVHRTKPDWRLVTADGAAFPAQGNPDDWRFTRVRERGDTNSDVARRVDEAGFCLFCIGLSFKDLAEA
ncbi:MAG: hypothetical protein J7521_13350 [Caulobacter sp.]|nr:hypothetical protein [Caulobacter sp.]